MQSGSTSATVLRWKEAINLLRFVIVRPHKQNPLRGFRHHISRIMTKSITSIRNNYDDSRSAEQAMWGKNKKLKHKKKKKRKRITPIFKNLKVYDKETKGNLHCISKSQIRNKGKKWLVTFMSSMFNWPGWSWHKGWVERGAAGCDWFLRFFLSLQLYPFIRTTISPLIIMAKLLFWIRGLYILILNTISSPTLSIP